MNKNIITEYEFVFDPVGRKLRVIPDNSVGYIYAGTGEPVEMGMVVHTAERITFGQFIDWATKNFNFLLDKQDDRVVKIYENDEGYDILCCDGFFDEHYLPWDEFSMYDTVFVAGGNQFVLMDTENGRMIEFYALGVTHIDINHE